MKNKFIYALLLVGVIATSCYRDKGNYDYSDTPRISTCKLVPSEGTRYLGEEFSCSPVFTYANYNTPQDTLYDFVWVYEGEERLDTVCTQRELTFVPTVVGQFHLTLIATNRTTGNQNVFGFNFSGKSRFTQGWCLLTNKNNQTDMYFIRPTTVDKKRVYQSYPNLLSTMSPKGVGTNPYRIYWYGNYQESKLLISQDNPVTLTGTSLTIESHLIEEFVGGLPNNLKIKDYANSSASTVILADNGLVYQRYYDGNQGEYEEFYIYKFMNVPMQLAGKEIVLDRFLCTNLYKSGTLLGYDKVNKRFLVIGTNNNTDVYTFQSLPSTSGTINLSNLGDWELIWGADINGSDFLGNYFGIFKNKTTDAVKIQNFSIEVDIWGRDVTPTIKSTKDFSGGSYLTADSKFCGCASRDYLFFSGTNAIYWYSTLSGVSQQFYPLKSGETVRFMQTNPQETELVVLTSTGRFIAINIGDDKLYSDPSELLVFELTGISDVIDMLYVYGDQWDYTQRVSD